MIIENIPTLKIQKLTQEQYDTALENNALDKNSIYLTPTVVEDYAFKSDLETKADLVDGKVPFEQLPDDISAEVVWEDIKNKPENLLTSIPDEYITETELSAKGYLTEHQDVSNFVQSTDLKTVATSGLYADLDGIPSEFTPASHDHDGLYYTESEIDAKVADLNATAQKTSNLTTVIDATSTDEQYPSAKAVYDLIGDCGAIIDSINTLVGGESI